MCNQVECGGCSRNIPNHLRTIRCSNCLKFYHVKCTDINTKDFIKIRDDGNDWNCISCRTPIFSDKVKCAECKKTICKNRVLINCSDCKKSYHANCADISVDKYLSLSSWSCNNCISSPLPFFGIDTEKLRLTLEGKDVIYGDRLQSHPNFSIQTLLDKFPGTFSCEDFTSDTISSKYFTPSEFLNAKFRKDSFSVFHINIVSLSAHLDDLKTLLDVLDHPFDIIGISETKIRENIEPITNLSLNGYNFEFSPTLSHFGGVGLYIKQGINYTKRVDLSKSIHNISESIFVELASKTGKKILVGCIYRHHSPIVEFVDKFLAETLKTIDKERKKCILLGDFNIDLLKFDTHDGTRDYYDLLSANCFKPSILQPTRLSSKSASLIDNIFYNDIETSSNGGNLTTSISDHFPQFCLLDIFDKDRPKKEIKFGRSYKHFNQNEFENELKKIDWNHVLQGKNSDSAFEFFFKTVEKLLDEMAPVRRLSKKEMELQKRPWITFGLLKSMGDRDKIYKKLVKEKDITVRAELLNIYKIKRNLVKMLTRKAKRDYYISFFEENRTDIKKTWEGIRNIVNINKKTRVTPTSLNYKNEVKSSKIDKARALNDFFVNIGNGIEDKIPHGNKDFSAYLGQPNCFSLTINPLSATEVVDMIKVSKTSKACGPNSIPSKILKANAYILAEPLTYLINLSLIQGKFPQLLKLADVCPIYKKNDKNKCENYRPISLLSNLSKLYERAMHRRIYDFLENCNVFYELQFGFRKKYSTNHALLSIVEGIKDNLDTKKFGCGVFIDLEKAFDTVNHRILLSKLEHYGIRGVENDWFRSYLTSRMQRVRLDGVTSDYLGISCGVPQGSILGPLLFLLYINDMNKAVKNYIIHHFADDTNLLCDDKNPDKLKKKMNEDLKLIFEWLCSNRLSLNVSKTEFIVFKPPRRSLDNRITLKLNGKTLYESSKIKYLGLIMDDRLTWKHHIFELRKKINKSIGIISKMKYLSPLPVLLSLYYSLVHSHLNYGICVWGNAAKHELDKIFLAQKKVVRIISNADYHAHTAPLFAKLGILRLEDIYKSQIACLMWDHEQGNLPKCFTNYLKKVNDTHNYATRMATSNKLSLNIAVNTKTYGQTMFKYTGSRIWNSVKDLPFYHVNIKKVTFKKNYKKYLIGLY